MLPGGMLPVTQLIAIVRSSRPRDAAALLAAMPAHRLPLVLAEMRPTEVARLIGAEPAHLRGTLAAALGTDQMTELLRVVPAAEAAGVLSTLPDDRLASVVEHLPDHIVSVLLVWLPPDPQSTVLAVMNRDRRHAVRSQMYENAVADALVRANAAVDAPDSSARGILVARSLGRRIAVAARCGDEGHVAVRDAVEAAHRLGIRGALAVIDRRPADDIVRYCRDARTHDQPIDVVVWVEADDDNSLKRGLVRLLSEEPGQRN